MTEQEQKDTFHASAIASLQAQRNAAQDALVNIQGRLDVTLKMLDQANAKIAELAPAAS